MKNQNKPFSEMLESGIHKYELLYFNIKILKDFAEDPRYTISNFDDRQNISISTEYDYDEKINDGEKIVIDNIGFGYDEYDERVIGVFLKQLAALPSKMQQIFYARRNNNNVYLDPSYIKSINGSWSSDISVFDGILYEIQEINKICTDNGDEKLFEDDFKIERPELFKLILLPTKKEYEDFIRLFDKMIYDNVNKKFFNTKIELRWKEMKRNGSNKLIEMWLTNIKVDKCTISKITTPIKDIRTKRNIPSHEIHNNVYDKSYYEKQTEALIKIYTALKLLIKILIKQFNLKDYKLEEWFVENNIRTYSISEIKKEENKNYIFMEDYRNND